MRVIAASMKKSAAHDALRSVGLHGGLPLPPAGWYTLRVILFNPARGRVLHAVISKRRRIHDTSKQSWFPPLVILDRAPREVIQNPSNHLLRFHTRRAYDFLQTRTIFLDKARELFRRA